MREAQWKYFRTGDTPFIVLEDSQGPLGAWIPDRQKGRVRTEYTLIAEIGQGAKPIRPKEFYDFCDNNRIPTNLSLREFARVAGRSVYRLDTLAAAFWDCARQRAGTVVPFLRSKQRAMCLSITGT